ncbi:hypothetical protein [Saccharothrix sp.]|uniref:hypothetical protein n=1 Tax=Saccharothrix sp. TaxID=1873460 RepID=UPI0028111D52|nr:hypothetical protein [Saccharothrix sp.]
MVAVESSTSNATRMCPATRHPTSTSSMYSACGGSVISNVARPASRIVTRPPCPTQRGLITWAFPAAALPALLSSFSPAPIQFVPRTAWAQPNHALVF